MASEQSHVKPETEQKKMMPANPSEEVTYPYPQTKNRGFIGNTIAGSRLR